MKISGEFSGEEVVEVGAIAVVRREDNSAEAAEVLRRDDFLGRRLFGETTADIVFVGIAVGGELGVVGRVGRWARVLEREGGGGGGGGGGGVVVVVVWLFGVVVVVVGGWCRGGGGRALRGSIVIVRRGWGRRNKCRA